MTWRPTRRATGNIESLKLLLIYGNLEAGRLHVTEMRINLSPEPKRTPAGDFVKFVEFKTVTHHLLFCCLPADVFSGSNFMLKNVFQKFKNIQK